MLLRQHPDGLTTPPPVAIAHHIIRDYVEHGADVSPLTAPRILCAGIIVLDEVFRVEEFPQADGKVQANGFFVVNGGCAANAAVAIARLGGRAALAGRWAGRRAKTTTATVCFARSTREKVDCTFCQRIDGLSTALSAIFMNARGDRTIVTYRDERIAATRPADAEAIVAAADAVLVDNRYPAFVQPICEAARRRGRAGGARRRPADRRRRSAVSPRHTCHFLLGMPARDHRALAISPKGSTASRARPRHFSRSATGLTTIVYLEGGSLRRLPVFKITAGRYARRRRRFSRRLRAGAGRRPKRGRGHALRRRRRGHQMHPDRRLGRRPEPARSRGFFGGKRSLSHRHLDLEYFSL